MIKQELLAGWSPVAVGAFGDGQPTFPLDTPDDYLRWLNPVLGAEAAASVAPRYILTQRNGSGGGFLFGPQPGGSLVASDYEYRATKQDDTPGAWQTCPSFLLGIDNQNYPTGSIEVRAKAVGLRMASKTIANRTPFTRTIFPFEITPTEEHPLGYYIENHVLKIQFTRNVADASTYMHIVTNGYPHDFDKELRPLGFQIFEHDLSQFVGSTQRFYLETNGGYRSRPDLYVTVT